MVKVMDNYLWLLVCCLSYFFTDVSSTCSPATEWQSIPENEYDRNFSSITSDGKQPLGFQKGTVYWNQDTPNPCIAVKGTSGKWLQILAETVPPSQICYQYQTMNQPACFQEFIVSCQATPADTTTIEFSCDTCEEADVTFWYRFTLSPPSSEMDPEMWCMSIAKEEYPGNLQPLPIDFTMKPTTKTVGDTGQSLAACVILISFILCLCQLITEN